MSSLSATDGFSPIVLLPTYHNAGTLADVVRRVRAGGWPAIVVDDGCRDATPALLMELQKEAGPDLLVETHACNQGKAAALMTGFAAAAAKGFTHAVTLDTDGQHDPEEIPRLVAAAQSHPLAHVLGERADHVAGGTPARSLFGRKFSNLMIRLNGGVKVTDSQSGFRVYPVGMAAFLRCAACRFGMETEILVRLGRAGGQVVCVPITSRYLDAAVRVSHFRPLADSLRAIRMHVVLALLMRMRPPPQWPSGKRTPGFVDFLRWEAAFLPLIAFLLVGARPGDFSGHEHEQWAPAFRLGGGMAAVVLILMVVGWLVFDAMALGTSLFLMSGAAVAILDLRTVGMWMHGLREAVLFGWIFLVFLALASWRPALLVGWRPRWRAWTLVGAAAVATVAAHYIPNHHLAGAAPFIGLLIVSKVLLGRRAHPR